MRGIGMPATLGTFAGAPDAPSAGPHAAGAASGRDAGGRALPFAAMLATRLVTPKSGAAAQSSSGETASEPDDDPADASAAPADATAPPPGSLAAVAMAMTAPAATTADVRHVSRDANALAPALRERLGRVVARMQREYGHDVRIAEAGRTQARQDYLFAQGRTRSGPVVTWTRDSAHTRGRAVDLTIDGGYDDVTAFARLQQIAQAEGLHTLGARDPGHLELPRDIPGEVAALSFGDGAAARVTVESFGVRTEPGTAPPPVVTSTSAASPGVAAVAPVAQVAAVAGVAQVATVASVGAPGSPEPGAERGADHGSGRDVTRARPSHPWAAGAEDPAPALTAASARASDNARSRGEGGQSDEHAPDHGGDTRDARVAPPTATEAAVPTTAPASANLGAAAPGTATPTPTSAATPAAPPVLGAIAAERIARVLDAQQAATPRTVSHLTLRVERAEGGEDRIRLDVRGRAVEARIDVADLGAADHLTARTPELRAALAQHGLTTDDIRVRSAMEAALDAQSRPDVRAAAAASERGGARFVTSPQHAGDGSPRDEARDSARDQPSPDSGGRNERQPDDRRSERPPRDGGAAERRASDQRQGRRPPPDAYLDTPAPRAPGRAR